MVIFGIVPGTMEGFFWACSTKEERGARERGDEGKGGGGGGGGEN